MPPVDRSARPSVRLAGPDELDRTDAVVVGMQQGPSGVRLAAGAKPVDAAMGGRLAGGLWAAGASGRPDEVVVVPTLGLAPFSVVIATGLGAAGSRAVPAETARRAVGAALRGASSRRVHVAIDAPLDALVEGALLGSYRYTDYKSGSARPSVRTVTVSAPSEHQATTDAALRRVIRRAQVVAEAVLAARDLVNTPPNDLYPETFAARAGDLAARHDLEIEVLGPRELRRGRYGGVLAVGAGSARPPRLVRMMYRPARPVANVALVGKGITFDSGGLNLKSAHLTWMKSDMGGGAAVLAATAAAAALRLPVAVTATVPMAENMPSGSAFRPSDVLTLRNGRTVEVGDTDAEGRLVLADALCRALEDEPDYLLEASTLTGAQLIALGPRIIAAMGEPQFRDRVVRCGNATGEAIWSMPIPDDLRAGLDSSVADLVNVAPDRWAAMLVGGRFLSEFMPAGLPWAHLDIAGPAFNSGGVHGYTPRGGTGAGVRTIVAALSDLAAARD